jgi:tRNA(fMet)-specific endonuclease VapC
VIHLDTSFLIDLLRETVRKQYGRASQFLDTLGDEPLGICVFVACELLMGAELSTKPAQEKQRVEAICQSLTLNVPDELFAPTFAKQYARQERLGQRIATMDLLIATSAILADAPLVTKNMKDFERVPALKVISYVSK